MTVVKLFIKLFDIHDLYGFFGASVSIIFPFLDTLNTIGKIAGVVGGLILLYYSIKHKRLQIKQTEQEIKEK